jgi:hypothetical protein
MPIILRIAPRCELRLPNRLTGFLREGVDMKTLGDIHLIFGRRPRKIVRPPPVQPAYSISLTPLYRRSMGSQNEF